MKMPKEYAESSQAPLPAQRKARGVLQQQVDDSPRQQAQRSQIAQLQADAPASNQTGMPDQLKQGIESLSGMDMSDVQVHRNSGKPAQLNALAYAQGNDIHLGPGQEQHLPHEAWHVVQQRQGRVKPTLQMAGGVPVNDDVGLEQEADVMGQRALASSHTADVSQRRCDECDSEESDSTDSTQLMSSTIQLYTKCAGSTHATTMPHEWAEKKYIAEYGGEREFYFEYGPSATWNFVDIVDGSDVYEIKPEGGQAAAKSEAEDYRDKLNDATYGCGAKNFRLGPQLIDFTPVETGLGFKLSAWSPESGVILYRKEDA